MSVWRLAAIFLVLLSFSVAALPDFTINATLNDNSFYTMPLLSSKILEYNYTAAFSGVPLDSVVSADIIKGTTSVEWWNTSFRYRTPITQTATASSTRATSFTFSSSSLIAEGKLHADCSDLRLYYNRTTQIPFLLQNCNSNTTKISFLVQSPVASTLYLYYDGSVTSLQPSDSVYLFAERFVNMTDVTDDWIVSSGNVSITTGQRLASGFNTTTMINLTNTTLLQNSEVSYVFSLQQNASSTLYLANSANLSDRSLSIASNEGNDTIAMCWNQNGQTDCSVFVRPLEIGKAYTLRLLVADNTAELYLDDEKLNQLPQYYTVSSAYLTYEMTEGVELDDILLLQTKQDTFVFQEEQEHIQRFSGTSFSGFYGFTTNLTGFETDQYTIATYATRTGMNPQTTINTFSTMYNRINFETVENGVVSPFAQRYIVDTTGTLKVTNPNDEAISFSILLNAPIIVDEVSGTRLDSNRLLLSLSPFSSTTINYLTSGILSQNPIQGSFGVLATLLDAAINPDFYTLSSSFTKEELNLGDKYIQDTISEKDTRKEIRYTVQGEFILDQFSKLKINKYFSDIAVRKGGIVDVVLRVSNQDPFSRPVHLTDFIPNEFVVVNKSQEASNRVLDWNFKMNKFSSKIFSYQMMYIGNSTGSKSLPRANLTSDRLLVYSNNVSLIRLQPDSSKVFVTKEVEIWNETPLYDEQSSVRVTISVANTGRTSIEELYVDDYSENTKLFVNPTRDTLYKAKWVIDKLKPGEVWYVSYLTNNQKDIKKLPLVSSYVQDVAMTGQVIASNSNDKISIWKSPWARFSLVAFVLFFIIADIFAIGYYVYRNPFFETSEKLTLNEFLKQLFLHLNPLPKVTKKLKKQFSSFNTSVKNMFKKSISWLKQFSSNAKRYYKEHNVSLVEEKSSSFTRTIKKEFDEIKELSFKDWIMLIKHGVNNFFTSIHNFITYGMFRFSNKLLMRNEQSKIGKIFNYSAKVLNPDLKGYMGHLISKKMEKKQHAYQREIDSINKLRKQNEKINNTTMFTRIRDKLKDLWGRLF